jgi:hypothetical protein
MAIALTDPFFEGLFWDTDPASLTWDQHATFICERVLERGTLEQWNTVRSHYGPERLLALLCPSLRLSRKAVAYLAACYGVSATDFRAWEQKSEATPQW